MTSENSPSPQLPPDILRYLDPVPESRQFDFLLGEWAGAGTRYNEDGSVLMRYQASWSAQAINEGRMIVDDFKVLSPKGQPLSSFVTLRTYSAASRRWEMTGLAALQPSAPSEWHGQWKDGEMRIEVAGRNAAGEMVRNKIRFFEIGAERFDWESGVSIDDGKSWVLAATVRATRIS